MKTISFLLIPLVLFSACQSSGNKSSKKNKDSSLQKTSTMNTNTSEAWISLFNGKNLDGWRGFKNHPTDAWNVENGTLHCNGHIEGAAHTDLITDSSFKDFAFTIKWKISPESNSGIMFHVTEDQPHTYLTGPEYQIIDDQGWPGDLEDWQHTGSNYAMQVPDSAHVNPVGEWNTTKIVVEDAHVSHWLNGDKILEYTLWSPEWKKQKAAGKWKEVASYGMSKSGHIALQYHGGDVWFKDIKIRKL